MSPKDSDRRGKEKEEIPKDSDRRGKEFPKDSDRRGKEKEEIPKDSDRRGRRKGNAIKDKTKEERPSSIPLSRPSVAPNNTGTPSTINH